MKLDYIDEPLLQFGYAQTLDYPRDGLFLFGPVDDGPKVDVIRYGVIGTPEGVEHFKTWSRQIQHIIEPPVGVRGVAPYSIAYPGFEQAFRAKWPNEPHCTLSNISKEEISKALHIENRHEAVKSTVDLYVNELLAEQNRNESLPDFWFVVLPEEVYRLGRSLSSVPVKERISGNVVISLKRAKRLEKEPTLFGEEEEQAVVFKYSKDFRRQLKARLLQHKIVTQLVRETTLNPSAFLNDLGFPIRKIEDPATIAWKLSTTAYYKAGGRPWQLANVRPGVCYVGLVYKRVDDAIDPGWACCAAQMFLSNGDGVVFRGALGPWYSPDKNQYHLNSEEANKLLKIVVDEYERMHGEKPKELFVHAKAKFTNDEWSGFESARPPETNLVGIQIRSAGEDVKLFRTGKYPVIRGTALKVSDNSAYLWTTGYIPRLDSYLGPETPNPISVRVWRGECPLDVVLQDILGLTKINFNSCLYNERLPVTIRFADAVGDVLVSAPIEGNPVLCSGIVNLAT
ncbi:MAG: hypothetical protein JAY74_14155 [Candidatus Thiodiazotropha taylori]|nr:hypothetical protein [Candidatus Thiodiazotropha taylori]